MIQTIGRFFACRAGMKPKDPKDRNPRNFNNGSNFNWRGIFLFAVYTSAVLGLYLFFRNGNYRSVDRRAPRPSYADRNRRPADSSLGEKPARDRLVTRGSDRHFDNRSK